MPELVGEHWVEVAAFEQSAGNHQGVGVGGGVYVGLVEHEPAPRGTEVRDLARQRTAIASS